MERKAFDVIAGSSFGGVTNREFVLGILDALTDECGLNTTQEFYLDLAKVHDDDDWLANGDAINDAVQFFNDWTYTLPAFCVLDIRDNEAIILPDLEGVEMDDDIKRGDDIPGAYRSDYFLHINDHGNTTLLEWVPTFNAQYYGLDPNHAGHYREVWSMV